MTRVAMIVTKTPSEPFAVVRRTLEAMLAQTYPHETWLADEDPAARDHRLVQGPWRADLHPQGSPRLPTRTEWPRRTR